MVLSSRSWNSLTTSIIDKFPEFFFHLFIYTTGGSCVAGALSWSPFLRFVQSMQRFVPRALFKMAAPYDILYVLLGRNGYGRNGYWPKWFWTENVQMTSDAFIFNYVPVLGYI